MKKGSILPAIFLAATLSASCGNNNGEKNSTADTVKSSNAKADTSIIPGDQKNIKSDSVSGDPSSKGAADPNAKLPKK